MAHDVFISYSSEDENVVRAVSNALEAEKIRCWYASRDIPPGADWPSSIVNAIQEAQVLLLIFTDFSNSSKHVSREVNIAISDGKPVIPFKLTPNGPTEGMKYYLESVHWLDAVDRPLEESIDKLIKRVKMNVFTEPPKPFPIKKWLLAALGILVVLALVLQMWRPAPRPPIVTDSPISSAAPVPTAASQALLMADVLITDGKDAEVDQSNASNSSVFNTGLKRSEVETITFLDTLSDVPNTAWDLSDAIDGSVMGWSTKNSNGFYDLYIAGNGGVLAPADCTGLFQGYVNLKNIDFGDAFRTNATTNMKQMFAYCPNLSKLDLGCFDTSHVTNMSRMFVCDTGLRTINFGEAFNTSKVTIIYSMFYKCHNLEKLDVSRFDTKNVTNIEKMFYGCTKLKALDVSGFDTKNVTNMAWMFYGCSGLTSLDVSNFDTSKVTVMNSMFELCSSLTSLDVSGFKTANVTDMSYMFDKCSNLASLDVSGFDTSKVTSMRTMFQLCSGLTSLDVSNFDTKNVTDMAWMFYGCSGLTSLDVDGFDTSNVTEYSSFMPDSLKTDWQSMFLENGTAQAAVMPVLMPDIYDTSGEKDEAASAGVFRTSLRRSEIESISFLNSLSDKPKSAVDISEGIDGSVLAWTNKKGNGLYDLYIAGEGGVYAPSDCTGLFNGYINLKTINFNGNFHTENAENFHQLFFCCPKLSALDLSGFDTSAVTDMSGMFCYSSELSSIVFGNKFDTSNVTSMTSIFYGCENLDQLDVSGFNTENCESMHGMFYDCRKLKSIDISNFATSKVKYMSYMFSGCSGLTSLDVSSFNTATTENMYCMFYKCSGLTELDVSHFDTSKVSNMAYMFSGCTALSTLDVSNFDTSKVTEYDYFMPDSLDPNWRDMFKT